MDEKQYLSVDGNSASGDVEALVRERVHSLYYDRDVNCARTTMLCLGELLGFHIEEQTYAAAVGMHGAGGFRAQCGLVEGALMMLGAYFGAKGVADGERVDMCRRFAGRFGSRFGSLRCLELRPGGFNEWDPPHMCEELTVESVLFVYEFMAALERDLHDTMMEFRRIYKAGRAIAAPQIGVKKRVLYMNVGEPVLLINPVLEFPDGEMMEVMDDCMSFPGLLVKVDRYRRCRIHYKDRNWQDEEMELEGDLSELLQHEYDHLDGILATMRAKDSRAFYRKMG